MNPSKNNMKTKKEIEGLEEIASLLEITHTHHLEWNQVAMQYGMYLVSHPETAYEETKKYINKILEDKMK